jgi:Kef-type K+ transport system membrane component KefB
LGFFVLAVVSGFSKGRINFVELCTTAVLAVGFIVVLVKWGTWTMGRVLPHIHQKMRTGEAQFTAAVILMFGLSVLASYAGVAAIIGAFLAGMALSGNVEQRVHDLTDGVAELLKPFFLAGIGLHLNLSTLRTLSSIWLTVAIILVAIASKFIGCGLASLRLGRKDALRVGIGMTPRGEVGMVVAQIGLSLGVVGQRIYDALVFMAVATTLLAPPLLRAVYKEHQSEANKTLFQA